MRAIAERVGPHTAARIPGQRRAEAVVRGQAFAFRADYVEEIVVVQERACLGVELLAGAEQ